MGINRLAIMGGAYGNVPAALRACIAHARRAGCNRLAFIGDATGFCGHSDATLDLIRASFSILVAGNLEQQAVAGSEECGCNYSAAEDEQYGRMAHRYAMESLSEGNRAWLATWPDQALVESDLGRILLCHGSPAQTNEFLYESELRDERLNGWLDEFGATGFACTHSGLPWIKHLTHGRFAVNCGVVGKPDNDGDPAVHYAIVALGGEANRRPHITVERVEYDHEIWAEQLLREGVANMFVFPVRTGVWTCGHASLPPKEREPRDRRRW